MEIKKLYDGADMRCANLLEALIELCYERGKGIPLPAIIGTIELLKLSIMDDNA